jgi:O-antigen ligase
MKYLSFPSDIPLLNRLAFIIFLSSGAFILLLWSPNILGRHISPALEIIIYMVPWIMLWPIYHLDVIRKKAYRLEIILIILIILLGITNVIYSENAQNSLPRMSDFLLTGIIATWVSMFIIIDNQRRNIFSWFCCCCFVIIAIVEVAGYLLNGSHDVINIFTLHSLPTGTMMILLSPGPFHFIFSKSPKVKLIGYLAVIPGGMLILLTEKRGTILAVVAIVLFWVAYHSTRVRHYLAVVLLAILLLIPIKGADLLKLLNPEIPSSASILHRIELYPFALHIWKQHPLMGIGLRPFTHENYLITYKQHNMNLKYFPRDVKKLQTFDDMLVTSFVELGTLPTLIYLGLIIIIIGKYCKKLSHREQLAKEDLFRLSVLLAFAVQSMTYDSLLFPPINWLFHVNLGILAGYRFVDGLSDNLPLIG